MASSKFHQFKQRRAERQEASGHGNLNLVPLVDILTSIVFFSLLTYTGAAMMALRALDLTLPPVVITAEQAAAQRNVDNMLNLLLAVRIQDGRLLVEHSEENGFRQTIPAVNEEGLAQLQQLMRDIKARYPQNDDVLVVPDDGTSYDDVVRVLERIKLAGYTNVSLGSRARVQVASAAGGR